MDLFLDVEWRRVYDQVRPVLHVLATPNELRIEVYQPNMQNGGLKALIDAGANWLDKVASLRDPNNIDRFGRQIYGKW